MNTLPARPGHRITVWPYLVVLALVLGAFADPAPAARPAGTRPSEGFRVLAREVKDSLQGGDYTRAEKGARELYDRFSESSNDIESATAATLLGRVLREQGKYAEAETLLRQALASREKQFGETDDRTIGNRILLARALTPQGKYAEAEAVLKRALDGAREPGYRRALFPRPSLLLGAVRVRRGLTTAATAVPAIITSRNAMISLHICRIALSAISVYNLSHVSKSAPRHES